MNYFRWLVLLIFVSCSTAKQEPVEASAGEITGPSPEKLASHDESYEPILYKEDSMMFVGYIEHHAKTNEFFVSVYFIADSVDETFFEDMTLALDSTIVDDDEITRKRLKKEVAAQNFNLLGLDTITVFSRSGKRLGTATFARVESLDEMIEVSYTAVFTPEENLGADDEAYYCISKGKTSFNKNLWDWHVLADADLDKQLLKTFDLDSQNVVAISHVRFNDLDATYSSVSMRGGRASMLVETKNGKSTALMLVEDDYSLAKLHPVHFSYQGHPVFLSAIMPNETDGYFEVLLAFNGEKYEMLPGSRTK